MSYIVGCYSQIPHGSPNRVYERALDDSLKPFLTEVYNRDKASLQLYMTGSMIEWLDNNHKEVNMLIKNLVKLGKLEILTGSYYQAILPLVPPSDRVTQIEKATTIISKRYKMLAKTFWCYGEIWDPSLISSLNLSKIENVIVSCESPNIQSDLKSPFRMQELGKSIVILPPNASISKAIMAYSLADINFDELYKIIKDTNNGNKNNLAMINLNQLLQGGIKPEEMARLTDLLFSDSLLSLDELIEEKYKNKPLPINYLDKGWYGFDSLLTSDESIQEVLSKDYGLSYLYNRLLSINDIARHYKKDRDIKKKILKLIPKIHCGAPFLCDANASLLRGDVRANLWKYLIKIEKTLNSLESFSYPYVLDVDKDGLDEVMSSGKTINTIIDPKDGSLLELKYYPAECNFADAIVPKGPFFKDIDLVVPGKKLKVFKSIILDSDYNMAEYKMKDNQDIEKNYELETLDKKYLEFGLICSKCDNYPLKFSRHYKLSSNEIEFYQRIENTSSKDMNFKAGVEIPLTFFPYYKNSLIFSINDELCNLDDNMSVEEGVNVFKITDKMNKARITISSPTMFSLLSKNIFLERHTTVGKEKLYQFSFFAPTWNLSIKAGEFVDLAIKLRIERR
ncbi:MAG: DUF1926 domain-containing protein [Spirochaetaceae bacterium]|nr:DUF1926 domain-containing protein [Spirochaetaceae bacterium]